MLKRSIVTIQYNSKKKICEAVCVSMDGGVEGVHDMIPLEHGFRGGRGDYCTTLL